MCMHNDSNAGINLPLTPTLARSARLPINRCNLPAVILGSLRFQQHPTGLELDGVADLHADLFCHLDALEDIKARAGVFQAYMNGHFSLHDLKQAGLQKKHSKSRAKADYLRMMRGWLFDSDGREGAVLKGFVESRFGLLARYHRAPVTDFASEAYRIYMYERCKGLYNTNALEAQLDLLYSFCQYELKRRFLGQTHLNLYRGVNRLEDHELIERLARNEAVVLLNNLNSFTSNRERADEFGDYILSAEIPLAKIFFFQDLLPGVLRGEGEYVVIGGVYRVSIDML